jgi:hypothetical protein
MMSYAPLVIAALLTVARITWGVETQDIVVEWTPDIEKPAMQVLGPTGRLSANQMVDQPYIRYGISEETQSQVVLTLTRQER